MASAKKTAPFGTWKSPIKAAEVARQSLGAGVEDILLDPVTSKVYYAQKRPAENGRSAIVDASDQRDMFDKDWNARTRFNDYGGGASRIYDGTLYFSEFKDNRIYKTTKGSVPVPITPENDKLRYADFAIHPKHPHLLISACEDHTEPGGPTKVVNYLVIINTLKSIVTKIAHGADFYICPRFSPDGNYIAWQQWYLPDMPYQSSLIMVAPVHVAADGESLILGTSIHVAGKANQISAQDPIWTSNSTIVFFSDISGYQNPWKFDLDDDKKIAVPVLSQPLQEEFGCTQYYLTRHGSGGLSEDIVAVVSFRQGKSTLFILNIRTGNYDIVPTDFAHIQFIHGDGKGKVAFLGQPANAPERITELIIPKDANTSPRFNYLTNPAQTLPSSYVSVSQYYELKLEPDNRSCHVNYYPPVNADYEDGGVEGEKPPVIVWIHGGPYSMEFAHFDMSKQFWTTRGWARLEVNYGGSTGFGRAYRESLNGNWGILDIKDAWQSVLKFGEMGLVDPERAVIAGQSAGGYSALQAATTLSSLFPSPPSSAGTRTDSLLFKAGMPRYGASEMRKLALVLPKFEYGLLDRAFGVKWEENKEVWIKRSPIYHADKVEMPMLFLQGDKDPIVPVPQMSDMVDAIRKRGVRVKLVIFEGEGHGWRKASTIQAVLEEELAWLGETFGLENEP